MAALLDDPMVHGNLGPLMEGGETTVEYGDSVQEENARYNLEFQITQCSMQQTPSQYNNMYENGTDVDAQVEWANPNGLSGITASFVADDLGLDLDFDESYLILDVNFTNSMIDLACNFMKYVYPGEKICLAIWDSLEDPLFGIKQGATANTFGFGPIYPHSYVGVCYDNNIIDHMWVSKRFSFGTNDQQIQSFNRPELLFSCEQKRRGEDFLGRTARELVSKLYPLYTDNITKINGPFGNKKANKQLTLQDASGRIFNRLSFGPPPSASDTDYMAINFDGDKLKQYLIGRGVSCVRRLYIPYKWFGETTYGKVDSCWPSRFSLKFDCSVGSMGDVCRFVLIPGLDAWAPGTVGVPLDVKPLLVNLTDKADFAPLVAGDVTNLHPNYIAAQSSTLPNYGYKRTTDDVKFSSRSLDVLSADYNNPTGGGAVCKGDGYSTGYVQIGGGRGLHSMARTGPTIWNKQAGVLNTLIDSINNDPTSIFYAGEYGIPIVEISMNPTRFLMPTANDLDTWTKIFLKTMQTPLFVKGICRLKAKSPTFATKEIQANYYSDSTAETTSMRIELTKVVKTTYPIEVLPNQTVVGTFDYQSTGQNGMSNSQTDTADYYKLYIVEESPASIDKNINGIRDLLDPKSACRYYDEVVENPWRTGRHAFIGDKFQVKMVQSTSKEHAKSINRTTTVDINDDTAWYYLPLNFQTNFNCPGMTIGGYMNKYPMQDNIPSRCYLPHIFVSAQFDGSYKSYNGTTPSKPRVPHIVTFSLICNNPIPLPSQPIPVTDLVIAAGTPAPYDQPVKAGSISTGSTGYRLIILAKTTLTTFLYASSLADVVVSEEIS